MAHFFFVCLALLAAAAAAVADTTCPSDMRGCNAPMPFSGLTASTTVPTIVASTGVTQDVKDKLNEGHQVLVNFIGGATPTNAYVWEAGGEDAAYAGMKTTLCSQQEERYCTFGSNVAAAQDGTGAYHKGKGGHGCACGQKKETSAALFYIMGSSDTGQFIGERGIHEMCHVVQMSRGEYFPAWLLEGGAVQMECLLQKKLSWSTQTYADCFKYSGGRGGIIPRFLQYYASDYGKAKGLKSGELMDCGGFVGTSDCLSTMAAGGLSGPSLHAVFYDVGAVAITWTISKARITSKKFWQSNTVGEGFWNAVVPFGGYDYKDGHPGTCPENKGWKKALLAISGHASMHKFYEEFDGWAKTATESDVLSILESQSDVDTATAGTFDLSTATSGSSFDPCNYDSDKGTALTPALTPRCSGSGGGGGGGGGNALTQEEKCHLLTTKTDAELKDAFGIDDAQIAETKRQCGLLSSSGSGGGGGGGGNALTQEEKCHLLTSKTYAELKDMFGIDDAQIAETKRQCGVLPATTTPGPTTTTPGPTTTTPQPSSSSRRATVTTVCDVLLMILFVIWTALYI